MNQPLTAAVRYLSGEREPVRVATTGNITLQGLQVIDDVELEVGDRVLVKDQTDQTQNGVYLASEGRWFRAPDANTTRAINDGVTVAVQEGTAGNGKTFRFSSVSPVVGTDAIILTYFLSDTLSADVSAAAVEAIQPFVDAAEEEADRAEAAQVAAEAAAASLNLPAIGPGDAGKALIVNAAGTGYETGGSLGFLQVVDFGAVGDWDPVARTGTDDTAALQAAIAAAVSQNKDLYLGVGVYYHSGELEYPSGLRLYGRGRRVSQFYVDIDNTMAGSRIQAQNVIIQDVGTLVYLSGALGPDDGEFGSGVTLSQYYTDGVPFDTRGIVLCRVGYYKAAGSPNDVAHAVSGVGRFSEVTIDDIEVENFSGAAVQFHWGANALGVDLPIVDTYHPNKLAVTNLVARNCGRLYSFSSCYDVVARNLRGINCVRLGDVIPGDETDFYADDADKALVGGSIHISDVVCDGISDTVTGALRVVSIGTSRADDDVATGLGTRRVLFWKNVLIENVLMVGANNVPRAIDLTGACGNITLRNINGRDVAKGLIGLRLADTRGNIIIENVSLGSQQSVVWERAWGAMCMNMDLDWHDPAAYSGDTFGVSVGGSEFNSTLSASKAANATSISLATSLGAALNPGDVIFVGGNHVKVRGARQIRSTETVIPIEAMPFTAASGAAVYVDQRSIPKMHGCKVSGYSFAMSVAGCKQVEICENEFIDIAKTGISGVMKSGVVRENKFIRGGQYRLTDSGYASRNIVMSAGSENLVVMANEFGIDADYIDVSVVTSADTGNLRVLYNSFDQFITAAATFASQSSPRTTAGQTNIYTGNYKRAGGAVP